MNSPYMSESSRRLKQVMRPLNKTEERRAINTAVTYLKERIEGGRDCRFRVLGAELRINKPARPALAPTRSIGVIVVDYTNKRNLSFLIDGKGAVEVAQLSFQPPFSDDEVGEADDLARRDPRIASLARSRGSFVSEFAPERPGGESARLVGLRYVAVKKGKEFQLQARLVVNLSERRVAAVEDILAEGGT